MWWFHQGSIPLHLIRACSCTDAMESWSHRPLSSLKALMTQVLAIPGNDCILAEELFTFDTHYFNAEQKEVSFIKLCN